MPVKLVEVADVGQVHLFKRRGSKSVRMTIAHDGAIRVTLPTWVPYRVALEFVKAKRSWIAAQTPESVLLQPGKQVGKAHHLKFEPGEGYTASSRLTGNQIRIMLPVGVKWQDKVAQEAAARASIRALKKEAAQLLPKRLAQLAQDYNFSYGNVGIRQLKGRWGSCDQNKNIVLNCYLMELPWELIDYVLIHELTHTKVMAHGPRFWAAMEEIMPDTQSRRSLIKTYRPIL